MKKIAKRKNPIEVARTVFLRKFPEAKVAFIAGSVIRGDATDYSDIDMVVVFDRVDRAHRESFVADDWPVEVFVHDPDTLEYFFQEAIEKDGIPSLVQMVSEGIVLPTETFISKQIKEHANQILAAGPKPLMDEEIYQRRYGISDLVDDLRAPRSREEAIASGVRIYQELADFYLRTNGAWTSRGKWIPRTLQSANPKFAREFEIALRRNAFFAKG